MTEARENGEQETTLTVEGDEAPINHATGPLAELHRITAENVAKGGAITEVPVCRRCSSANVVGPFEMDGMDNGSYRPSGMFWIVCRGCGTTTNVSR